MGCEGELFKLQDDDDGMTIVSIRVHDHDVRNGGVPSLGPCRLEPEVKIMADRPEKTMDAETALNYRRNTPHIMICPVCERLMMIDVSTATRWCDVPGHGYRVAMPRPECELLAEAWPEQVGKREVKENHG